MGTLPPPLEIIYRSNIEKDCLRHALVLEAAGIEFAVQRIEGGFALVVAGSDAQRSRAELDAYASENPERPTSQDAANQPARGWVGVLGFVALLVAMAVLKDRDAFGVDWFEAGKTNAGLIRQGQWWRTITALTLHVDAVHLLGNIVIGGVVGFFAGQLLGSGLAWLSILMSGALGNFINAWLHSPAHTSAGASTAVFAALGLIAAYGWQQRRRQQISWLARWAPLVGGVLLLSYLGTGGERTDVGAHVLGFLSGMAPGTLYGRRGSIGFTPRAQVLFGLTAIALLSVAWVLAWDHAQ